MGKVLDRRAGGSGIDLTTVTGFLRYVSGQDPTAIDYASQAEAEAGSNNTKLMTPLRVAQAITEQAATLSADKQFSGRLNESAAPTTANNANENDDQGNPLRVGSLWRYDLGSGTDETRWKWYELQGFNGSDAIWFQTDAVTAAALNAKADQSSLDAATSDISALQTSVTTLVSQMAVSYANLAASTGLITVGSGEVIFELPSVPNDNSTRILTNTSTGNGLAPLVEDDDYEVLGSWIFANKASDHTTRVVGNGDILDIDWTRNGFNPGAVDTPTASGFNVFTWNDTGSGGKVDIWKCPSGSNANVITNWTRVTEATDESAESYNHSLNDGDKVIFRLKVGGRYGVWSDIVTATAA